MTDEADALANRVGIIGLWLCQGAWEVSDECRVEAGRDLFSAADRIAAQSREIAELRARLERAEADARRYRWLRIAEDCPLLREASDTLTGADLDAAIDAAIAHSEKGSEDAD